MTVFRFQSHWKPEAAIVNGDSLTPNAAGEAYLKGVKLTKYDTVGWRQGSGGV